MRFFMPLHSNNFNNLELKLIGKKNVKSTGFNTFNALKCNENQASGHKHGIHTYNIVGGKWSACRTPHQQTLNTGTQLAQLSGVRQVG